MVRMVQKRRRSPRTMPFLQPFRIARRASRPLRVFTDRTLLHAPRRAGRARVDARHRRRLRADHASIREIAGHFDGHAGGRPPLLSRCRARRPRPQDARGQPVRPRGDGRRTACLHARVRAAACRRGVAGSVQQRAVRARGALRLRADRRRHHERPAEPVRHRIRRSRARRRTAARCRARRRRRLGVRHARRCARRPRRRARRMGGRRGRSGCVPACARAPRAAHRARPGARGRRARGARHLGRPRRRPAAHPRPLARMRRDRCRRGAALGRARDAAARRTATLHAGRRRRLRTVLHRAGGGPRGGRSGRPDGRRAGHANRYNTRVVRAVGTARVLYRFA